MMSIGHQLDNNEVDDGDEQERIQNRVQAVWKYHQDKLKTAKDRKKSSLWNLLTCAGGKSKRADEQAGNAKPYAPLDAPPADDDPNKQNKSEVAQLSERFARILRMLIDARCQVDQIDKTFGLTPLDITMLNGDMESSAVLASAGADPNHLMKMLALKELYQAIVNDQRKDVKQLLTYDEDLDVNLPFSRFNVDSQSSDEGLTPLTLAARVGDPEICKFLMRKGRFSEIIEFVSNILSRENAHAHFFTDRFRFRTYLIFNKKLIFCYRCSGKRCWTQWTLPIRRGIR